MTPKSRRSQNFLLYSPSLTLVIWALVTAAGGTCSAVMAAFMVVLAVAVAFAEATRYVNRIEIRRRLEHRDRHI